MFPEDLFDEAFVEKVQDSTTTTATTTFVCER